MGRLTSLLAQEFGLLWGFKRDLLDFQSKFTHIQAVLEDAEVKQKKSKAVQDWLKKLRAASFEIENMLDEISTEGMIRRVDREMGIKNQVRAFFSGRNPVTLRSKMAHRMNHIREKLEVIAAEKSNFGLKEGVSEDIGVTGDDMRSRLTHSLVNDLEIVGRDDEKKIIVEKICDENLANHGDDVSVYSIYGMGGIGKATLCQLVYNHQRVIEHFPLKMWVCVSEDFDVLRLTKAILECVEKSSCDLTQLDVVQARLREKIRGKRFLLVLDDVWSGDRNKWERLRQILDCGASGSVIMVTTRMEPIARMMSIHTEFVHQIGCLSKHESWSLFERPFGVRRPGGNRSDLEPIGRKIVEKCQGLPLAVKALGSLMWSKSSMEQWSLVLKSDIWDLPQEEVSHILPALRLSYDNLPQHYRQCFAYCCVLPKDYRMQKELMIQLWMANGFIFSKTEVDLYVVGDEIFNSLVWRSFFEDVVEDNKGSVTFKMHDLMHDLAKSVMGNECWSIEPGKELRFPTEVLHMSSSSGCPTEHDLAKVRSLRSMIILFNCQLLPTDNVSISLEIFDRRYLRALHLERIKCQELPTVICNLKLLRYLNLSGSYMDFLPESIIYLQNLEVLNLFQCRNLVKLPEGMRYMKKLQLLDIRDCNEIQSMPSGIGELTGLRRLSRFVVGEESGKGIEELGELNRLGWELQISRLEKVRSAKDAEAAKLKNKQNLIDLGLYWSIEEKRSPEKSQEVVECLEPHPNLKKLEIIVYNGLQLPSWMVNLVNLVEVKLFACVYCEILSPTLGKLPVLKVLDIAVMDALKSFDDDNNSTSSSSSSSGGGVCFPCLQKLDIRTCPRLIGLPSSLPKLEELKIYRCPMLIGLPYNLPKLEKLVISDCYELASLPVGMGRRRSYSQLSSLEIYDCPKLKCLPDGMQNLRVLKSLEIKRCEHLKKSCDKRVGEDWPKIAHVTHIQIDYIKVHRL